MMLSHASLGRALLQVFGCLQSHERCSRASEATASETPRWAGRRSLKQNCQSKELVPLATVMLEIGLRVGAKKHAQKSSYRLFAVKLDEGPGRGVALPAAAPCRREAREGRVQVGLLLVHRGIAPLLEGPSRALTLGMAVVVLG